MAAKKLAQKSPIIARKIAIVKARESVIETEIIAKMEGKRMLKEIERAIAITKENVNVTGKGNRRKIGPEGFGKKTRKAGEGPTRRTDPPIVAPIGCPDAQATDPLNVLPIDLANDIRPLKKKES